MIAGAPKPPAGEYDRTAGWTGAELKLWEVEEVGDGRSREPLVAAMGRLLDWRPDLFVKPGGAQRWLVERIAAESNVDGMERRVKEWMPQLLVHLGEAGLRAGDFARSMRYFDEFLRIDAAIPRLRLRKCVALYGMGKTREALQGLEELRGVEDLVPEIGFYREKFEKGGWPWRERKKRKRPVPIPLKKEREEVLLSRVLGPAGAATDLLSRGKTALARRAVAEALKSGPAAFSVEEWLRLSAVAKDAGWRQDALSALDKARDTGCGPDMAARIIREYALLGEAGSGLPLIRSLGQKPPAGGAAMSWLYLASVAFERGDKAAGLKALAAAGSSGPDGRISAEIARAYAKEGEVKRAGLMVRRAAGLGVEGFTGQDWLRLAHIARDAGDKAAGVAALGRAQKAGGVPALDLAKAYSALQEPRLAAKVLNEKSGPMTAAGYLETAQLAAAAGDKGQASQALASAAAADSEGALKQEIVRLYVRLGLFKDVAPNIRAISGSLSAREWLDLARSAHGGGDMETAAGVVTHALAAQPDPGVQAGCARLYAELEKPEQALPIAKALTAGPAALSSEGWADVAFAASRSGDRETALKALASAEALMSGAEEKRTVAVRYQELKEYGRSLAILDGLVKSDPRHPGLLSDRGVVKALMGRSNDAIEDLKKAVAMDPKDLGAVLTLGGLLSEDQALALYEKALKQAVGSPARILVQQERDRLKSRAP